MWSKISFYCVLFVVACLLLVVIRADDNDDVDDDDYDCGEPKVFTTALEVKNYSMRSFSYFLRQEINVHEYLPIDGITLCFWIRPLVTDYGDIVALYLDNERLLFELLLWKGKLSIRSETFDYTDMIEVHFGEWLHICAVYEETSLKVILNTSSSEENDDLKFSVQELKIGDPQRLYMEIGKKFDPQNGPLLMIGTIADMRLYFDDLDRKDINCVANFMEISKSYYSFLENVKNDSNFIPLTQISTSLISSSSNDNDFLWFFDITRPCIDTQKFCRRLGGTVPSTTLHSELVKTYFKSVHYDECPFWMFDSENNCKKSFISPSDHDLKYVDTPNTNLYMLCVIPKLLKFVFKHENEKISFSPDQEKALQFYNSAESLFMYYERSSMKFYIYNLEYEYMIKISEYLVIDGIMGRHNWTHIDCGNETGRAIFSICSSDQFTCSTGDCINMSSTCDFVRDCEDVSDEGNCEPGIIPIGYYPRELPPRDNTKVSLSLNLERIANINMNENTVELCLDLEVKWVDDRLIFKYLSNKYPKEIDSIIAQRFWSPLILIDPVLSKDKEAFYLNKYIGEIHGELKQDLRRVEVLYGYEVYMSHGVDVRIHHKKYSQVSILCNHDLSYYPFDVQDCTFFLSLPSRQYFNIIWDEDDLHKSYNNQSLPSLFTGLIFEGPFISDNKSQLKFTLHYERKYRAYIFNTLLPCVILDIIGFWTFFMPYDDYNDRVTTTLSCLIVLASLFAQISSNTPESSEPKLIDVWMFAHILVLFVVFIFNCIIILLVNKTKQLQVHTEDSNNSKDVDKVNYLMAVTNFTPTNIELQNGYFSTDTKVPEKRTKRTKSYESVNLFGLIFSSFSYVTFLAGIIYCIWEKPFK